MFATSERAGSGRRTDDRSAGWYETALSLSREGVCRLDWRCRFAAVDDGLLHATGHDRGELLGEHVGVVVDDETARACDRAVAGRPFDRTQDQDGTAAADVRTVPATVERADGTRLDCEVRVARPKGDDGDGLVVVVGGLSAAADAGDGRSGVDDGHATADGGGGATADGSGGSPGRACDGTARRSPDGERGDRSRRADGADEPSTPDAGGVPATASRVATPSLWKHVAETVGDGIYLLDGDGRFAVVNDAFASMIGYERSELLGAPATMVCPERFVRRAERAQTALEASGDGTATVQAELESAGGTRIPVECRLATFELGDGERGRVGVVRDVTERRQHRRKLTAQRERLATLLHLNGVVDEIHHAVVEADTRGAVERAVCEQLAAADPFTAAWFAEAEPGGDDLRVRTAADVDGPLEGLEDALGVGEESPSARALRTGTTRTVDDVRALDVEAAWREHALEFGYRSIAAIPVIYQGICYGVLTVCSLRAGVFDDAVRDIVSRLGPMVGHALSALDRRRALVGDEVTEIEFRVEDVLDVRDVDAAGGRVEYRTVLPTGDGSYVAYGTASGDGVETLRTLVEELPHYEDLAVRERRTGGARFTLQQREPPVASLTADLGGRIDGGRLEGNTLYTTVHLPYDADVRSFVERVTEEFPGAEVLAQRRTRRSATPVETFGAVLDERLTERQRVALEAAYVAGYFQWPREATGEDVADAMGVSPATFHEHFRTAERRVVSALFDGPGG